MITKPPPRKQIVYTSQQQQQRYSTHLARMATNTDTADKPAEPPSRIGALSLLGFANKEELGKKGLDYLMNPKWSIYVSWFLLVVDAVLCALILRTVNCMWRREEEERYC
jgi:hypothetical protein